jgi:hypothetical protein
MLAPEDAATGTAESKRPSRAGKHACASAVLSSAAAVMEMPDIESILFGWSASVHGDCAGTRPLLAIFRRRRARPPTCSRAFLMVASTLITRRILSYSLDEKNAQPSSLERASRVRPTHPCHCIPVRSDRDAHRPAWLVKSGVLGTPGAPRAP